MTLYIAFILLSPQYGKTALYHASINGYYEVAKLLLQSHADVNVKDKVSTESPHLVPFTPIILQLLPWL